MYVENMAGPRFDVDIRRFDVRLSDYEKVKQIASGAFGSVHSGRDTQRSTEDLR
jgi:hypothetical protein